LIGSDADVANVLRRIDVNKSLKRPIYIALGNASQEVSLRFTIPEVNKKMLLFV
jgi:hypothetical protein